MEGGGGEGVGGGGGGVGGGGGGWGGGGGVVRPVGWWWVWWWGGLTLMLVRVCEGQWDGFGHGVWWNRQEGGEEVSASRIALLYALMMPRSGRVVCHQGTSIM